MLIRIRGGTRTCRYAFVLIRVLLFVIGNPPCDPFSFEDKRTSFWNQLFSFILNFRNLFLCIFQNVFFHRMPRLQSDEKSSRRKTVVRFEINASLPWFQLDSVGLKHVIVTVGRGEWQETNSWRWKITTSVLLTRDTCSYGVKWSSWKSQALTYSGLTEETWTMMLIGRYKLNTGDIGFRSLSFIDERKKETIYLAILSTNLQKELHVM